MNSRSEDKINEQRNARLDERQTEKVTAFGQNSLAKQLKLVFYLNELEGKGNVALNVLRT